MKHNKITLLFVFFISCAHPVKTTYINKDLNQNNPNQYNVSELIIYSPLGSIKDEYSIVANIEVRNDAIQGNLIFDQRMKKYLLYSINEVGANALIYNENESNEKKSYFKAIRYLPLDSMDVIYYD
mgnify:CR=1 FL=1